MNSFNPEPEKANPKGSVVGMHFVCRAARGVVEVFPGVFLTGCWSIDSRHSETVNYVALHESKAEPSYQQGRVLAAFENPNEPGRFAFVVQADEQPREWVGQGTGEKGYRWDDQGLAQAG